MVDEKQRHSLTVAVDGKGVTPATVDTPMLLRAGLQYIEALQLVSSEMGEELVCTGMAVTEGSAGVAFALNLDAEEAADAVDQDIRSAKPSAPARALLDLAREAATDGIQLYVANDNHRRWNIDPTPTPGPMRVRMTARVKVLRSGGARPSVRLQHLLYSKMFTLEVGTQQIARDIAQYLYMEIDVEAEISKHDDGRWSDGRLITWHRLDDGDPTEAWQRWFAPNAEHWRTLSADEINRELGRDDEGS